MIYNPILKIKNKLLIWGLIVGLNYQVAFANPKSQIKCRVDSPANQVAVVELFTSEGCSSCPPADNWLINSIKAAKSKNQLQVIYLSNHVDYWDYIGWRDRFALPTHSLRQRAMARSNQVSVYTPQFFVNGISPKSFRSYSISINQKIKKINANKSIIDLSIERHNDQVKYSWKNAPKFDNLIANIVWTTGFTKSNVDAGENRLKILQHAQVSRIWEDNIQINTKSGSITRTIPEIKEDDKFGMIVFFVRDQNHKILQSVSLARNCI